jgi:hypothetical protein
MLIRESFGAKQVNAWLPGNGLWIFQKTNRALLSALITPEKIKHKMGDKIIRRPSRLFRFVKRS